ncbi:hypothetical protein BC829DRAFT_441265 [Chytridium lagenaria]|nr:hypothetical protein BC829DRAFT_441265 [Chytridium lagenaria]
MAAIIGWVHGGDDIARCGTEVAFKQIEDGEAGWVRAEDPASMCELLDLMEEFDVDPDAATSTYVFNTAPDASTCMKRDVGHVSRYVDLMNAASGNKGPHRGKRNVYDSPRCSTGCPFYKVMLANSARFDVFDLGELRPMHRLYKRMKAHGVSPNLETFRILAFSHLKHSSPDRAFAVLDSSKEGEVSPSELRSLYQAFFGKLVEMGNVEFGWMTLESMMKTCQSLPDIKEVRKFEMLLVKRQDFERLWKLSAILDRSGISPPLLRFSLLKMITFARKKEDRLNPRSDLIRTVVAALEMGNSVKSKPSRFVYNHWLLVHVGDKEGFVRILKEMMRLNLGFDEQTFFLILAHALKWRNFSVVWAVWTRFLAEYDLSKNLSLHADSVYGKRDDSTVSSSSFKFGPASSKTLLFAARKVIFASFKNKQTKAALHVVLSLRSED